MLEAAGAKPTEHLDALFAALGDAVLFARFPDRRVLDVNPAYLRLFGLTREEALAGTTEGIHVDADHFRRFGEAIRPAIERGEPASLEWPLRHKDGAIIPCHVTLSPVRAFHGEPVGVVSILRDLREAKARESELALRRAREDEVASRQDAALRTLLRVQQDLTRELELGRLVQAATAAATPLTGAAFGAFFYNVSDPNGERYTLYTISGVDREHFSKFPLPRKTAVFAPTFDGTGIVRSDDITKDPRYGKNAPRSGMPAGHLPVRSYLAIPVVSREGVVHGGLFFGHPEPGRFDAESEEIAAGIAAHTAIALDNAHLYRAAKESEERIRDREAQLAQAQQIAHLGSWSMDLATGAIEWSAEQYRIHGLEGPPPGGMDAERFLALVHPDDRAYVSRTLERIAADPAGAAEGEYRIVRPDGVVRHLHARARVERSEGKPVRALGTSLDITERRLADRALRESEERFRTLVTATTQMVWTTDEHGMVVDLPEWRAFTGQSAEEVRGAGWADAIHPDDRERTLVAWGRAYAARAIYDATYRVRGSDGQYRHFHARGVPRFAPDGRLIEYIGTWTDVTEEKRALQEAEVLRAQLVQGEKLAALGSLVSGVAHEIRTPLTYLSNNLHLVESAVARALAALPPAQAEQVAPAVRERLAEAHESIARVGRIVEDLRRYTRLRAATDRVSVPLDAIVRDAVEIYRATHRGEVHVDDDLASTRPILADRVQIQQVVLNLLQNAGEAGPRDGRVCIRTRQTPEGSLLEVEDQGEGIPPEVLARIWDPFFTTKKEGTGLGLSIVKRIVEVHGAAIQVESHPGLGTRFRVVFPTEPFLR